MMPLLPATRLVSRTLQTLTAATRTTMCQTFRLADSLKQMPMSLLPATLVSRCTTMCQTSAASPHHPFVKDDPQAPFLIGRDQNGPFSRQQRAQTTAGNTIMDNICQGFSVG